MDIDLLKKTNRVLWSRGLHGWSWWLRIKILVTVHSVSSSVRVQNKVILSCGTTSHACGHAGQGTGIRVIACGGVFKTGSGRVSSQGSYHSVGRLTSRTSWVAGVEIALGMTFGDGGEVTGYAGRASSDEELVSLLIAHGWTYVTSDGALWQSDVFTQ